MNKKIRFGLIGCSKRGTGLLTGVLIPMLEENILLCATCDKYIDRAENAAEAVEKAGYPKPFVTADYKELIAKGNLDAVIISSSWETHVEIATAFMRAGIPVGLEVGGAYSLNDCWKLVNTYEETGTHCMLLENCCYGKRELMLLNMVRSGILGEIVHCAGGYQHDLRSEITGGPETKHYRFLNYLNRNCENYPTHELGPIAKLLNINNGNRLVSLASFASSSRGLNEYIQKNLKSDDRLADLEFAQGDIVTTVIKCAKGQTIQLTLDTTLPRSYSRGFTVRGTAGSYFEDTDSFFFDGEHDKFEFNGRGLWGNAAEYEEKHLHKLWRNFDPKGGHDGMDWMVLHAFFDAVEKKAKPPIDVYDTVTYMCISALSEESIALGGQPVAIPDFTQGKWYRRTDLCETEYALDQKQPFNEIF
ncbi:MAG: Gfo/Idh/MocA family oxidoreductase [Clostridia bacterium]|nr:Gfo/Idh/MocA family oxidoreductase [Clostridia bacterium]